MSTIVLRLAALALAASLSSAAGAQERVRAGSLTCDVSAGIGFIIGSKRTVHCTFTPSIPGPIEIYTGSIKRLGVDLGVTAGGVMIWLVYAPTTRPVGGLSGSYVGASGQASAIAGLGANVLVGGSNQTVALQPLSIEGQAGINVALGVADLDLQFVR